MKVLYLIDGLKMGGKERQLIELIKGLINNKHIELKLGVMNKDIHYPEVFDLNIDIIFFIREYKKDIRIFIELYHLCKTFRPDIIHSWDSMTAFYTLPIAKWLKIKIINGSIRNATSIKLFSFDWFSKLTFPYYDKIISNSLAGLRQYKISKINGYCIHNGFDFSRITELKPIKDIKNKLGIHNEKVIGMVASFTKKKDWKSFFDSANIILAKRDDVVFLAVGNGPLLEEMKLYMGEEMRGKIIILSNYHPVEEIINVFNVGVLATDTDYHMEGISNSIMEYMALGKPVIATDCGGNSELIINEKTGFLAENKAVHKLSEFILQILDNQELMNSFGSAGKKRIRKNFNINTMINKYRDLYDSLYCN